MGEHICPLMAFKNNIPFSHWILLKRKIPFSHVSFFFFNKLLTVSVVLIFGKIVFILMHMFYMHVQKNFYWCMVHINPAGCRPRVELSTPSLVQ